MINFISIAKKTLDVTFDRAAGDYKVVGQATYINNEMTYCSASVRSVEADVAMGNFDCQGRGIARRVNVQNIHADKIAEVLAVARETIAELDATYPQDPLQEAATEEEEA